MFMGHSSSRGIVIGDTARPVPNAVYGCWRDGKIVLEKGEYKSLVAAQKREAEPDDKPSEERGSGRLIFGVMGLLLLCCAVVWKLFGFVNFLAALVFSVLGYFPLMAILYARRNPYKTAELHEQFRRFHGCEHACVRLLTKHRDKAGSDEAGDEAGDEVGDDEAGGDEAGDEAGGDVAGSDVVGCDEAGDEAGCQCDEKGENWLTMSNLIKSPIYDSECGSVYAGYFFTLACEIGLFLSNFVDIGFFRSVGVILSTVILFLILIFLPWNPYKRLQYPAVAKPGKREYEMGLEILREMQRISAITKNP